MCASGSHQAPSGKQRSAQKHPVLLGDPGKLVDLSVPQIPHLSNRGDPQNCCVDYIREAFGECLTHHKQSVHISRYYYHRYYYYRNFKFLSLRLGEGEFHMEQDNGEGIMIFFCS